MGETEAGEIKGDGRVNVYIALRGLEMVQVFITAAVQRASPAVTAGVVGLECTRGHGTG